MGTKIVGNVMPLVGIWWLLAVLVACSQDETSGLRGTARDSSGVRVIQLPRLGASDEPLRLSLDSTWAPLRSTEFGDLLDVEALGDGRVVLLDRYGGRVLVASSAGELTSEFGGAGDGPGEFRPMGLSRVVATDSSLIVPDLHQQRLSEFTFQGELVSVRRFPGAGQATYAVDWRRHPGGGLAFRALNQPAPDVLAWMRRDELDTIHTFPPLEDKPNLLLPVVAMWDVADTSLVTATSGVWEVTCSGLDTGRPKWIARRETGPLLFRSEDRAALEAILVSSVARETGGTEPTGAARASLLAQVTFPQSRPALADVRLAPNGDVWVRNAADVREMGREALRVGSAVGYGGTDWDVLDPDGMLKRRIRLPSQFRVTQLANGWLYGIVTDDLGVQRPARVPVPS